LQLLLRHLGLPYIDLAPLFDTSSFADVDEEVCLGLSRVETSYTGGSLKWMGVVAPPVHEDGYVDYMYAIQGFSRQEFARFISVADSPEDFDLDRYREYRFGDETDHPLTRRQMLYLKFRYGVYFPWKVTYHLLDNVWWEDKNLGAGKGFHREAIEVFPRTVDFIRALPFREVGRVVLFGLEANDPASGEHAALLVQRRGLARRRTGSVFSVLDTYRWGVRAGVRPRSEAIRSAQGAGVTRRP
jgi:hypothetical protein